MSIAVKHQRHRLTANLGNNEPPLPVILSYARAAGVRMEALVDDDLALPGRFPGDVKHDDIKRKYTPRPKTKR